MLTFFPVLCGLATFAIAIIIFKHERSKNMKWFTKKSFAIVVAIVLVLSLVGTVFAAWPGFQSGGSNNGVITAEPPTSSPATETISLPVNGTTFSGVDTASVIDDDIAYTLFNGGVVNGAMGGARLSAVNVSTGVSNWNIQLDADANNVSQLSTPLLVGNTLYAATTYYTNLLEGRGPGGWGLTSFNFPNGATTTITTTATITIPEYGYWEPQVIMDVNLPQFASFSGAVNLIGTSGTLNLGTTSYYEGNFTLYNANEVLIPAGNYSVQLVMTNNSGVNVVVSDIQFLISQWHLWSVNAATGAATQLGYGSEQGFSYGYGQANTPISTDGTYIYFGIFEGDRSYYQYTINGVFVNRYIPNEFFPDSGVPGDDFYNAGAYSDGEHVWFGSDSGVVYGLYVSNFQQFDNDNWSMYDQIRSTVVYDGNNNFYFTAVDTGTSDGYLIRLTLNPTSQLITSAGFANLPNTSTSTPVISDNDIIYVGWGEFSSGGVNAYPVGFANNANGTPVYVGDPVKASPIVWSDGPNDFIYFTTNTGLPYGNVGGGYCYSYDGSAAAFEWSELGTSSNTYALQGFASDSGVLIYGDDGNYLYVMK